MKVNFLNYLAAYPFNIIFEAMGMKEPEEEAVLGSKKNWLNSKAL
jgi:hypothetical protein